jgi:outer membrane lipoprotein LolB
MALTGLAALLAACASAPKPPADAAAATSWQGRLAMTVDSQPPERMAASFTLQGSEQAGSLALFTPLGSTIARAEWNAEGATLTQGQNVRQFASLDEMLAQFASAALPVQALFDWLQGRPRDVPGWHVNLSGQDQGRISATRQYPQPTVDLRLILD